MKFLKIFLSIILIMFLVDFTSSISVNKEENFSLDVNKSFSRKGDSTTSSSSQGKNNLGSVQCSKDNEYFNIALNQCVQMKENYE